MPHSHPNDVIVFDAYDAEYMSSPMYVNSPIQAQGKKRQQARRACVLCKRLHAKCSNERPCKRCDANGVGHTCQDSPRKQRMSRPIQPGQPTTSTKMAIIEESVKPRKEVSIFANNSSSLVMHDLVLTHLDTLTKEYQGPEVKRTFTTPITASLIVPRHDDDDGHSPASGFEVSKPIYAKNEEPSHSLKNIARASFSTELLQQFHQAMNQAGEDIPIPKDWNLPLEIALPSLSSLALDRANSASPLVSSSSIVTPVTDTGISSPFNVQCAPSVSTLN